MNMMVFYDTLPDLVGAGLKAGESVIVIATEAHVEALDRRLNSTGVNIANQYITLIADEADLSISSPR
jgi:hypothetical protein